MLIALDNGHGLETAGKRTPGFTDGTKSPYTGKSFMHEWEVNRRVVQLLKVELERCGFDVIEISPSEDDMPINDRYKKANAAGADYFLSVHANALYDYWNSANGIEVLAKQTESSYTSVERARLAESYRIGRILQTKLVAATGLKDRCAGLPNKILERDNIGVLNWTKMPANLVELGFMDNPKEAKLLLSEDYRKLCAVAIAKSLCEAFKVTYKAEPVKEVPVVTKPKGTIFPDMPDDHWAASAVKAVKAAGVMNGVPSGDFEGDRPVTRYELAAVVAKLLNK